MSPENLSVLVMQVVSVFFSFGESVIPAPSYVTAFDERALFARSSLLLVDSLVFRIIHDSPSGFAARTRVENDTLFPMRMFLCRVMADK